MLRRLRWQILTLMFAAAVAPMGCVGPGQKAPMPPALPATAMSDYPSPNATVAAHDSDAPKSPRASQDAGPNALQVKFDEPAVGDGAAIQPRRTSPPSDSAAAAPSMTVASHGHWSQHPQRNAGPTTEGNPQGHAPQRPLVIRSQSPQPNTGFGFDPYRQNSPRVAQGPGGTQFQGAQPLPGPPAFQGVPEEIGPIQADPNGIPNIGNEPFLSEQVQQPGIPVPVDVYVNETQTGRFMFGVGVNSDAGLTGQIVVDERNFDYRAVPTSYQDWVNGTAFRGGGQGFRMELLPGTEVQRYLFNFTQPYLFDTPISFNLSGFYYNRNFFDWDEERLGGRISLGYRLTHDLSLSTSLRAENVGVSNPRVLGVADLDEAIGDNSLYSGRVTLSHDTRDIPFAPTEGHLIELSYEQVFGTFDYPRAEIDYRQYFLIRERPDGSGRHTLSYSFRFGFTGAQTPIYENYFAGGYSTMRGFDFRGASPVDTTVTVGGEFRFLGSVEYLFPLTGDDAIKGVVFCDFGTVEEQIEINAGDYRVAPGVGLRIAIPALGPAPLALDFAVPVAREDTDDVQNFSFFIGFGR